MIGISPRGCLDMLDPKAGIGSVCIIMKGKQSGDRDVHGSGARPVIYYFFLGPERSGGDRAARAVCGRPKRADGSLVWPPKWTICRPFPGWDESFVEWALPKRGLEVGGRRNMPRVRAESHDTGRVCLLFLLCLFVFVFPFFYKYISFIFSHVLSLISSLVSTVFPETTFK